MIVRSLLVLVLLTSMAAADDRPVKVASKSFTESVLLGEMVRHLVTSSGTVCEHQKQLGGSQILFKALRNGDLDIYPEYTGTLRYEILASYNLTSDSEIVPTLETLGIKCSAPLGFNNTYAMGMTKARAAELGITKMSDLNAHPDLKFGFSNEFMDRGDGWPALQAHYQFPQRQVRGLDHDIAYRALQTGDIDVIDLYSTDAEIRYYDLAVLIDDRQYFPRYDAVLLYRADLAQRAPLALPALLQLEGAIDEASMVAMNASAKLDRKPEAEVAATFVRERFNAEAVVASNTVWTRLLDNTLAHFRLVGFSMGPAVLVAVPLGLLAAKRRRLTQIILGGVGLIQTVPALALLVLLMGPLGWLGLPAIGENPAIIALFLYSLLPIVRNTYSGIQEIPGHLRESAEALGLTPRAQLLQIELPLASRLILAGVKTAFVINIGFATLGALIGAGGYGQPILTGIRLDNYGTILEGALPAAGAAVLAQVLFELSERYLVPRGLQVQRA